MPRRRRSLPGERESRKVLRDRIRAWWLAAVAGQVDQSYPIHGTDLTTRVEDDTLVISGTVPSKGDLREIERETQHLIGHGVAHIRNDLKVVPQTSDARGLLAQTLLATYASAEQAGYAAGYLEGHATLKPLLFRLIPPDDPARARAQLRAALPCAYWREAESALGAGQALLLVMVDELDAFTARELLEEETSSLNVLILPPEAIGAAEAVRAGLRAAEASRRGPTPGDHNGDTVRRKTRDAEAALHEH